MMVLKRKIGQSFHLGEDIKVTVLDVRHGRHVRFGIEAPAEVPVHRMEIYELIQRENRAAGGVMDWFARLNDAEGNAEERHDD